MIFLFLRNYLQSESNMLTDLDTYSFDYLLEAAQCGNISALRTICLATIKLLDNWCWYVECIDSYDNYSFGMETEEEKNWREYQEREEKRGSNSKNKNEFDERSMSW